MSSLKARLYDYPVAVTLQSGVAADPNGPFAGLFCETAGSITFYPLNGPALKAAAPITMTVIAGQYLDWPVFSVTSGTGVFGLVSTAGARPGGFTA